MQKAILTELKELRSVITKLVGSSDLPIEEQFSKAALDKAAKEFLQMSIQRSEWVPERDISRYVKTAPWYAGEFIRKEFGFSNFFKQGRVYFYNKNDLIALSKELKERNVNLSRYVELKHSQETFKKSIASASANKKSTKKRKSYQLPDELFNITTTETPKPSIELVKEDLKRLEEEFFKFNLADYIDIYRGNYAMMKNDYTFLKYRNKELGTRCRKWCDSFNYANHALQELTKKRGTFTPIKEDEMIEL